MVIDCHDRGKPVIRRHAPRHDVLLVGTPCSVDCVRTNGAI